jgi:hypothetical protein
MISISKKSQASLEVVLVRAPEGRLFGTVPAALPRLETVTTGTHA